MSTYAKHLTREARLYEANSDLAEKLNAAEEYIKELEDANEALEGLLDEAFTELDGATDTLLEVTTTLTGSMAEIAERLGISDWR